MLVYLSALSTANFCNCCNFKTSHCSFFNRRHILQTAITLPLILNPPQGKCKIKPGDWSSPGLSPEIDETAPKFIKKSNGLRVQELEEGSGESVRLGDTVVVDYVLRRSNGYFIYSTVEGVSFQPRDVPIGPITFKMGDPDFISGFTDSILGMKVGGRRRCLVPPEQGYQSNSSMAPQPPNYAGKRQILNHANEFFLFEIVLEKIRSNQVI